MARRQGVLLVWLTAVVVALWSAGVPPASASFAAPVVGAAAVVPTCHGRRRPRHDLRQSGRRRGSTQRRVCSGRVTVSGGAGQDQVDLGRPHAGDEVNRDTGTDHLSLIDPTSDGALVGNLTTAPSPSTVSTRPTRGSSTCWWRWRVRPSSPVPADRTWSWWTPPDSPHTCAAAPAP